MKKLVYHLLVIVFAFTTCKNKEPDRFTTLGDYTPYSFIREKLNGKVEKVTEKVYWTIPDGDTFKKGNIITLHERDSLNWYYDFEVTFDNSGDLKTIYHVDENNKVVWKWELFKENDILTLAKRTYNDTLRQYNKIKCNPDGDIIEVSRIEAGVDTLISSYTDKLSMKGDTNTREWYDYSKIPINKRMAVVDEYGQFLNVAWYDKDGVYTGGRENKFNEKGKLAEMIFYDKDKNVTADWVFSDPKYDNHGNWITGILKDTSGITGIVPLFERTYTYYE